MTDLTPERLAEMRARHRDSCPMGNNRHGTPERPDWGTFCMDCKESWPCEASTLLDALAASEKNTEAEHVWGESWKATAEAEKAAREEAERAVAAEAAEYELMVAQRNEQEARADKAERDLAIVRHAINEAEQRAAVAEQELIVCERASQKNAAAHMAEFARRRAAEAQVAALRDGITQLADKHDRSMHVTGCSGDDLRALLARVDAPKPDDEEATCGHPNHGAPDHDCAPFTGETPCPDCAPKPDAECTCGLDSYNGPGKGRMQHGPWCRRLLPKPAACNGSPACFASVHDDGCFRGEAKPDEACAPDDEHAEAWVDRQGDVWTLVGDGLMHTPETAPFPREHVEKKWGPLRPVEKGADRG